MWQSFSLLARRPFILRLPNVALFSYIREPFVYCPALLDRFNGHRSRYLEARPFELRILIIMPLIVDQLALKSFVFPKNKR